MEYRDWTTGATGPLTVRSALERRRALRPHLGRRSGRSADIGQGSLLVLVVIGALFLDHRGRRRWSWAWRSRGRSPGRCTSCSSAPSACGRATSRTASRSTARDQLGELAESFNSMTAQHRGPAAAGGGEAAARGGAAHRARDPDVAAAAGAAAHAGPVGDRALRAGARGRRRLLRLLRRSASTRVGVLIADVSGKGTSAALYMAELKGLVLSLSRDPRVAARAADRGQPHHRAPPRHPQLHHDDLRRDRPATRAR